MVSRSAVGTMAQSCAQAQKWVHENYEKHPDGVVAKSVIYKHYEEYCKEHGRPVMETSIFGRVVKQVFHDVNIRRLGGRDNLKYYYCGIQAQATSPYVGDNSNTTRPKRKQRKRVVVADKQELQGLVQWLCTNYVVDSEGCVSVHEMHAHYTQCSSAWSAEPVNLQQLTTVVLSVFPSVAKRKMSHKSAQQYVFAGLSQRPTPLDAAAVSRECASAYECMASEGKFSCTREGSRTPDDEDEYSCRTPESEGSDMSAGNSENSSSEIKQECLGESSYYYSPVLDMHGPASDESVYKSEPNEPVDYSIATLRLKDEPVESMMGIKEEKLSDSCFGLTPHEVDTSHMMGPISPSPPQKSKNRIYKPRFHINYHEHDWSSQADIKSEKDASLMESSGDNSESVLRTWLLECLEVCSGVGVNCDQVYAYYNKYCFLTNTSVLSGAAFDSVVKQTFPDDVSLVRLSNMTMLAGVRVIHNSDIYGRVEEILLRPDLIDIPQSWEPQHQSSLEMSSPPGNSSSPITLDDDDEEEDIIDDNFSSDRYRDTPDDDANSIPEVMRDGKFYLRSWLTDNFESVPEACVLKADAYRHYDVYIRSVGQTPFEMNVFGKIVRQVFPKVSIRRLGGRMKPQYHYCGITAKPTSPLYALLSGKDPAQRSRKKEIATDSRTAEIVIDWLRRNYEPVKDRLITKSLVYTNFNSYCASIGETPVSLNYFGKLVKHCFPNVEVRKFGGRTEPNWYYYGLNPKDPSLLQHSMSIEEFAESSQCEAPPSHSSSNPIAVPGCGAGLALDSPYSGSPQVLMPSSISQLHASHHHLLQQKQHLASPYSSSPTLDSRAILTADAYPPSPGLSRAFKEGLMTHSSVEGQRTIRSPYEPDVAPDIFPRSPEETPAQTCRSPSALHMSTHQYLPGVVSSSPNSKRGMQATHSPGGFMGHASLGAPHGLPGDPATHKRIKQHQVSQQDYSSLYSGRS